MEKSLEKTLTDKERQAYINGGYNHCPYCDSENISIEDKQSDDNYIRAYTKCDNCERCWTEVYTLTEIIEDE